MKWQVQVHVHLLLFFISVQKLTCIPLSAAVP